MKGAARSAPAGGATAPLDGVTWMALAALVALGAALRLYGLDHQSLWNDELSSLRQFSAPSPGEVMARVPRYHAPGYWLAMHLWIGWLGDSETALRLPSALAGIATIPAMFALGRRWYGRDEGLIAAGLVAVCWMPVFYSQEARPYAALLLGVALSTAWLVEVVGALGAGAPLPRAAAAGYVVAAAATCWTHYFGVFAVGLQAAAGGLLLRRHPRALAVLGGIYAAVLLAYAPALHRLVGMPAGGPNWMVAPEPGALWTLLLFFFNRSAALAALALALWTLLLARGALDRRAAGVPATLLLVAWLVVPVALLYVYSRWVAPTFLDRALIIVAPAAYLLFARALTQLPIRRGAVAATATGLLALLLVDLVAVKDYYRRPVKEQFREAVAYLVARDTPGSAAVVVACAWNPFYFDYYLARQGSARRVELLVERAADAGAVRALVAARQPEDLWLLVGHKRPDPALLAALATDFTLADEVHLRHVSVRRYRGKTEGGAGD